RRPPRHQGAGHRHRRQHGRRRPCRALRRGGAAAGAGGAAPALVCARTRRRGQGLERRRGAARPGRLPRAQPDRRLADEGPLPGDLLPQRRHLLRGGDAGADLEPLRAAARPRRPPLYRPLGAGLGAGGGELPVRGHHHIQAARGRPVTTPIRVLIVDDSATMRSLLTAVLRRDPAIEVGGHAADAAEARQKIKPLNPDVVTLDIEMPNMNGLDFLDKIMRLRPMPVIMVSSLTGRDAAATLAALEIGAFDCIAKASFSDEGAFDALLATVKAAARARIRPPAAAAPARAPAPAAAFAPDGRVVAIGASTGGVEALVTILSQFPANCPPTVITQHMPPVFTKSFAERLNRICRPEV